jgi:hypothetical protein
MEPQETEEKIIGELSKIRKALHHISIVLLLTFLLAVTLFGEKLYQKLEARKRETIQYLPSVEDLQVSDAKNTTYQNGLVSVIINTIDSTATWKFFPSDNGKNVVEVNGMFPSGDIRGLMSLLEDAHVLSPSLDTDGVMWNSDKGEWNIGDIASIAFRIQFIKDYEQEHTTEYNRYKLAYAEIILNPKKGKPIIIPVGDTCFYVMDSYIRKFVWKME